jgi:hypothetical protein
MRIRNPGKMLLRFPMTVDALFHRYASTVLEIHKMNEELNSQLRDIAEFTAQLGSEEGQFSNTVFTSAGDSDPQDPHVFGTPDPNLKVRDPDPAPNPSRL